MTDPEPNPTTDRALLEAAAKAAGIKLLPAPDGSLRNCTGMHPEQNIMAAPYWSPLTDDGDALRLAVALQLSPLVYRSRRMSSCVVPLDGVPSCQEPWGHDGDCAATRRAIVRAAAAVGAGKAPFPTAEEIRENWTGAAHD